MISNLVWTFDLLHSYTVCLFNSRMSYLLKEIHLVIPPKCSQGCFSELTNIAPAYLPTGNRLPTQPVTDSSTTGSSGLEQLIRTECPDPVRAGLLSDADAFELFELFVPLNGRTESCLLTFAFSAIFAI